MKNRKRFQKFMLSAIALTTLIPFTSHTNTVHATYKGDSQQYGMRTYGLTSNFKNPNKGKGAISPGIGIYQHVNSTGTGKVKVRNDENAQYVHDNKQSGILRFNRSNINQKHPNNVQAFGPSKSRWGWSKEGSTRWYVYTYGKNQSEKGKVGVIYKNALTYYPTNDSRYKQPVHLDARLVWNGSWKPKNDKNFTTNGKDNIQFSTDRIAVKEPFSGVVNVTLQLYKTGTNKKFYTQSQLTQTDIDHTQGIIFKDPAYLIYSKNNGAETKLNAGSTKLEANWDTSTPGESKVFGDDGTNVGHHKGTVERNDPNGQFSYIPKAKTDHYTLSFVHDFTNIPWAINSTNGDNWRTIKKSFASPTTAEIAKNKIYLTGKVKHFPNNYDTNKYNKSSSQKDGAQADYFGYNFDRTTSTYKIPIDKQVSTKPNHFEDTSNSKKALQVKNTQPIYFDIHTQLKEPSTVNVSPEEYKDDTDYSALPIKTTLKDPDDPNNSAIKRDLNITDNKSHQGLVLRDYIDKRFKVEKAYVVYSKNWGDKKLTGKAYDASKFFKVYQGTVTHKGDRKGYTAVDAVLRPDKMKADSNAWMKDYHLIIQVKLKDNIQPDEGSLNDGYLMYDNQAYLGEHGSSPHSWIRVNFKNGAKDKTTTDGGKTKPPEVDSLKYVFPAKLDNPDQVESTKLETGSDTAPKAGAMVHPDQYLYYRLKFTLHKFDKYEADVMKNKGGTTVNSDDWEDQNGNSVKKGTPLINDKYRELTITDDLSDKFRNKLDSNNRDIDHVKVVVDKTSELSDTKQNHKFTISGNKLTIKLNSTDDKEILDKLSKDGGNLWIQC